MKILRTGLLLISIILFSFALSILIPSIQPSKTTLDDLILFSYLIGILISGILILFNRFDLLSFWLEVILLIITIVAWIKFPMINIIYTFFIAYLCICLLTIYIQKRTKN